MDPRYRHFGQNLQDARKKETLGQQELADMVGISRASISNIEGGRQRVPLHLAFDLAGALRVDLDKLWTPRVVVLPLMEPLPEGALADHESVRDFVKRQQQRADEHQEDEHESST